LLAGCKTIDSNPQPSQEKEKAVAQAIPQEDNLEAESNEIDPQEILLSKVYNLPHTKDPDYGKTPEKPIQCGGVESIGRLREYEIMSRLQTENRDTILAKYLGYYYPTPEDSEYIDVWQTVHENGSDQQIIYMDAFHEDTPMVPTQFTYLSGANPVNRSKLYPSANDAPLDNIRNIDITDGIDYEESIIIAQCYIIRKGLSVDFDVNSVQYEEGSNSDTHIISFYKMNPNYGGTVIRGDSPTDKIYKTLFDAPKLTVFVNSSKEILVWSLLDVYSGKSLSQNIK
jgi:hypothetical protein